MCKVLRTVPGTQAPFAKIDDAGMILLSQSSSWSLSPSSEGNGEIVVIYVTEDCPVPWHSPGT